MLSIIIVNYNVKYFLEQCLYSVQKAIAGMDAEVIVVDNSSNDESVGYLQKIFPGVQFIANTINAGFAKANNQAWQIAKGEYILFLNPDTILGEDCLQKSISVLEQDNHTGALGIHMVDGSGRFLPESKRGFPGVQASFFKLSGLIKFFPHSKTIAAYYMGHLPEKEDNEIDVLSGAYMMVKNKVLKETGGFDEQFFMYGEDIDLSYRIKKAGYRNYYLATSSIVHFKGESTQKDSRYTRQFYTAMGLFVEKHYGKQAAWSRLLLQLAIAFRGMIAFAGQYFFSERHGNNKNRNTIIAGQPEETGKLMEALMNKPPVQRNITRVGSIPEINKSMDLHETDEVIFCAGTLSYKDIIDYIKNREGRAAYKFSAAGSKSMVGSRSKNSSGEAVGLV